MNLLEEGSVTFWAKAEPNDWARNDQGYEFPPVLGEGIEVRSHKNADKTVQVNISDQIGNNVSFVEPMPSCDERGLFVAVSWKAQTVTLHLNGKKVASKKLLAH